MDEAVSFKLTLGELFSGLIFVTFLHMEEFKELLEPSLLGGFKGFFLRGVQGIAESFLEQEGF